MITSAIIYIFGWMLSGVVTILPSGTLLPAGFATMFSTIVNYAYGWDWLFPIAALFEIFSAFLVFTIVEIAWKSSKWFVQYLRGN